jgi:hypothetical protein
MTPKTTASSCADVCAGPARLVNGALAALVLAGLLAGVTLGVARLLLALVLPAESEFQHYLEELARSQAVALEP